MTLLLAADTVALYPPGPADAHGFAEPEGEPYWRGTGNLQLSPGPSDPRATEGGGHGPFGPAAGEAGVLYLPEGVEVRDGTAALVRGRLFALSATRLVADPLGDPGGGLACQTATATAYPRSGAA